MLSVTAAAALLAALARPARAMDNGLVRTPPLGWMSWMYYTEDINEDIIKGVADEMVAGGYAAAGYRYVSIDDGWSTSRDPVTKELVADPVKFPSGIPALAEYVHSKGLLLGIYADVGSLTCGGYSGLDMDANLTSQQYVQDVATFARWNVDALKVDGCYEDPSIMNITYPALSKAINASGHAMWLSCSWPCYMGGCGGGPATLSQELYLQLREYCNTWRDFNDMYDNIDSLYNIIGAYTNPKAIALHNSVNGPGSFSDADMLAAGGGGLSAVEEAMQVVMWAMFATPMMLSNDLPNIPAETRALLTNPEIIAVNQDMSFPASFNQTDDHTYCRNLADNAIALAGLHQTSLGPPYNITLSPRTTPTSSRLSDCILPSHAGVTSWNFRDALKRADLAPGEAVDCLAGQPGVCLVIARPQ
jgi:alpha-N-acetylgalactosaminidase